MSRNFYTYDCMEKINNGFSVSDDTEIFRYMNFVSYIELLESKKIFFCNPKEYEDAFESEMPEGFYNNWTSEMIKGHKKITKLKDELYNSYVSCWNMGKAESYALWKIYTDSLTGVAIKSTVGDLRKSLNNDSIDIYKVKYIDSFEESGIRIEPPFKINELTSFRRVKEVYKLSSYSYENELRAIYTNKSDENGMKFKVDLSKLINKVYVSPFAPKRFYDLVKKISGKASYSIEDKEIVQSEIKLRY